VTLNIMCFLGTKNKFKPYTTFFN